MIKLVAIRCDNDYPECRDCAFINSDTCDMCDDADQFEPGEDALAAIVEKELLAA